MNTQFDQHIKEVLQQTIRVLIPNSPDPNALIAPHVWRDSNYVGTHDGKVVVWRGWRARLDGISNGRYRTLYIDKVDNVLPLPERQRLFGEPFSRAIAGMHQFVVMFTLGFPFHAEGDIIVNGFVPRYLSRVLHACWPVDVDVFQAAPATQWVEQGIHLLELQSRWAKSKK